MQVEQVRKLILHPQQALLRGELVSLPIEREAQHTLALQRADVELGPEGALLSWFLILVLLLKRLLLILVLRGLVHNRFLRKNFVHAHAEF